MPETPNIPQMPEPQPYGQPPSEPQIPGLQNPEPPASDPAQFPDFISNIGGSGSGPSKKTPPRKKEKKHKKINPLPWLAAIVVLSLTAAALFIWPGFLKPSDKAPKDPLLASVEDVLKQNEACRFFLEDKGKTTGVDLSISSIGQLMAMITEESTYAIFPGSGTMNFTAGSKLKEGSFSLDVTFMGLAATAQLYYTDKGVTFKVPEVLGEDAYYLPFENMDQALAGSIFNPNSGTAYAMDQKSYNDLLQVLQKIRKMQEEDAQKEEEVSFSDRVTAMLDEQGLPHTFTSSKSTVDLSGETLDVEIQTLSLTTEDLLGYIRFVENLWTEGTSRIAALLGQAPGFVDLSSLEKVIEDNHYCVNLEYTVYQKRAILANLHLYDSVSPLQNAYDLTVDFGKNPLSTDQVTVTFGPSLETPTFTALWQVKTNTDSSYSWDLEIRPSAGKTTTVKCAWNKATGELSVSASPLFTLAGTLTVQDKKLEFSPGALTLQIGRQTKSYDLSLFTVNVTKDRKISKISGKSKDIFALKEEEMNSLIENVQSSTVGSLFFTDLPFGTSK